MNDEVFSRGVDGKELAIYVNWNIKQTNIWGIGNEGYITTSDVPNFYLKDHLGSIRIVTNENDEVISAQDGACPRVLLAGDAWGYLLEGRDYESEESVYKFTGKERDEESEYDYFGARYYDSRIGRWGQVEPIEKARIDWSSYVYSIDNPISRKDDNGNLDRPIYDLNGYFLGTDDEGLHGDAIIMDKESFQQGMSPEIASTFDLGYEGLLTPEAHQRFSDHFNNLSSRPDYDGYLTLEEANNWYREGSGEALFTSLEKIDLSGIYSLGDSFVGQERAFNLLLNSNSIDDGLVYGSITLKRYPNDQVRAYADEYDFRMHDFKNPLNWPRNIQTLIAGKFAGEGQSYFINIYGSKKLNSLIP